MAQQALLIRDLHTAQDQLAALHETMNIITMTNAHRFSFLLLRAGQVLPRGDLQIGVVALGQLHRASGQLEQAAIVGDEAGLFCIQLFQRSQIGGTVEALGGLHRIQCAAVGRFGHHAGLRHGLAVAAHSPLDGVLHRDRRGRGPAGRCGVDGRLDDGFAHKGAGCIVDGHKVAVRRQHTVLRALGAGGPAGHYLHRLWAGRSLLLQKGAVLTRHQHDLIHQRALRKGADAPLYHGLPAQIKAEFVEPHPGGGTCGHQDRRHTFFHF